MKEQHPLFHSKSQEFDGVTTVCYFDLHVAGPLVNENLALAIRQFELLFEGHLVVFVDGVLHLFLQVEDVRIRIRFLHTENWMHRIHKIKP